MTDVFGIEIRDHTGTVVGSTFNSCRLAGTSVHDINKKEEIFEFDPPSGSGWTQSNGYIYCKFSTDGMGPMWRVHNNQAQIYTFEWTAATKVYIQWYRFK